MAATEFAGRGEGGPETGVLVCYIKEPTLYESESSGEPMKDIREVTLSALSTQKDHSGCTVKARLEELQIRDRKSLCVVLGFGGSFMAPSPSPVTPAQNNLLQPNFEAAFGTTPSTSSSSSFDPSVFDGLGDLLMPTMAPAGQPAPISLVPPSPAMAASKALGSDLDSSLASLVGNLGISGTTSKKGDLQWNAGEKKLTGGANWQPKVAPATWSAGVPPSAPLQGAVPPTSSVPPVAGAPSVGQPGAGFGMPPAGTGMPMMPQQPVMFAQPMMRPPFGVAAVPGTQLSPSPTPASQSPKKPPAKDPLADLNIKDFL